MCAIFGKTSNSIRNNAFYGAKNNNLEDCDSTDIVIFEPANRDKLVSERVCRNKLVSERADRNKLVSERVTENRMIIT